MARRSGIPVSVLNIAQEKSSLVMGSLQSSKFSLPLSKSLSKHSIKFGLLFFLVLEAFAFDSLEMTFALKTDGSDESLDFGSRSGSQLRE